MERVDAIPWQVVALAGLIGFLVLLRYLSLHLKGEL